MTRHQIGERLIVAALILIPVVGCATLNQIEPVQRPPKAYQLSRPILVEFLSPPSVMVRCIQRGTILPAMACATEDMITFPNPCLTNESYARMLCHELAHANGWQR